jgi:alkylation response protein AidB-like acyl-CoA dehydrogenase
MPTRQSLASNLAPTSWALHEDQQGLRAAARQFAHERLEPLIGHRTDSASWRDTVKLAATLDLASLISPEQMGGMGIHRGDLALVLEQFAAGSLEHAAELTLSSAALMTLRGLDALYRVSERDLQHYFDGTTSIALGIPDVDATGFWVLRQHAGSPVIMISFDDDHAQLTLATLPAQPDALGIVPVAVLGALSIEHVAHLHAREATRLVPARQANITGDPIKHWLTNTAIYLTALLSGAVQHSVRFALAYSATRHTFRKPILAHQLVAVRLADMLTSAHTIHLFLRWIAEHDGEAPVASVSQMALHTATEAMDVARELVQLCGGHGYVEGLTPAARFQSVHWFAMLLLKVEAALSTFTTPA